MRHLISTLQTHNQQMKGEVVKFKLRLREAQQELNQVRETCKDILSHLKSWNMLCKTELHNKNNEIQVLNTVHVESVTPVMKVVLM